jgi:hypothetical protein
VKAGQQERKRLKAGSWKLEAMTEEAESRCCAGKDNGGRATTPPRQRETLFHA